MNSNLGAQACDIVVLVTRDHLMARTIEAGLAGQGLRVISVGGLASLPRERASAVILDGVSVQEFRLAQSLSLRPPVPVLALVGEDGEGRVSALKAGADDCMSRPADPVELAARIRRIVDHSALPAEDARKCCGPISVNGLVVDPRGYRVSLDGNEISLTLREFQLLLVLASRKGDIVSRQELMERVWGNCRLDSDRTLDVHICRLRKKIEPPSPHPRRILLVRGLGYRLAR